MKYQQNLQVAVRERLRRLITVPAYTGGHEIRLTVAWIQSQAALRGFLAEASRDEPDGNFEALKTGLNRGVRFKWPSKSEAGRASLIWQLMQEIALADEHNDLVAANVAMGYSGQTNVQDAWREFAQDILQPLFDFLSEQVGSQSSILHTLERYRTRIEWFDREELFARFSRNTRNGEEVYNLDLQRFLYLDGDYITHAKPRSGSGEADLIGDLDGDDPLVCDGKVFDATSRDKSYIAKGVHQIIKYAHDYGKTTAYLVIYNISDRLLEFESQGLTGLWPPYIELSGVRIYFITVRALPPATTASKAGKAAPVRVKADDLVGL